MIFTKELAAKGAAILGAGGAGGTGLYYGGGYLVGGKGDALLSFMGEKENNHVTFKITKEKADDENLDRDLDGIEDETDIKFTKQQTFVVRVVSASKKNTAVFSNQGGSQRISADSALSCNFEFQVEGNDYGSKTIKPDHKTRP